MSWPRRAEFEGHADETTQKDRMKNNIGYTEEADWTLRKGEV